MQCPYCSADSEVIDSRTAPQGIRRRRTCKQCRRRFTTYEAVAPPSVKVVKRDGKTEPFAPDKIMRVLARVARGRPTLASADIQRLARALEAQLVDEGVKSIRSGEILDRLLALVADVDRVACDRLAADYIDEAGTLRTGEPVDDASGPGQLGLFGEKEDA